MFNLNHSLPFLPTGFFWLAWCKRNILRELIQKIKPGSNFIGLFVLILLVPIPTGIIDSVTLPMRYGLSIATETILRLFHYPITREGLLLLIGLISLEYFLGRNYVNE